MNSVLPVNKILTRLKTPLTNTQIMKTFLPSLLILLYCTAWPLCTVSAETSHTASLIFCASEDKPKVGFSFDHLANNKKVVRLFVSEEMISAAKEEILKSDRWAFTHVVDRLTSLLSMHTHSRSTTATIRGNYETILTMQEYDLLMHQRSNNIEIMVLGVRGKGRQLNELLIFRFRDEYCSRVVQLTGKFTVDDIARIIKLNEKQ